MIKLRIYTNTIVPGTLNVEYADITDISIDARGCSGVGFASQEARMAEVELVLDEFLEEHIVNGSVADLNYLGFPVELMRDNVVIFSGFIKKDADILRVSEGVRLVRLRIHDIFWVFLDFAEGKTRDISVGSTIYPATGLRDWLNWVKAQMPEAMRYEIEVSNNYEQMQWAPYFAPGTALFDWTEDDALAPEFPDIKRRSIVMYESGGELYFEYCLHDTLTFLADVGQWVNATYWQHLVWRKYRITDRRTGQMALVTQSQAPVLSNDAQLADSDPATVAEWIANLPSIVDTYSVMPENGLTEILYDGLVYLVRDTGFYLNYHPAEAVWVGDGSEESEGEIYGVDVMSFIEDMTKLLCAWLEPDGFILRIKNRMVLPSASGYSVSDDEVFMGSFRREKISGSSFSMDCSYLVNGDLIREGVEKYYNELFMSVLPYGFEFKAVLGGHDYRVGEVVDYGGWIILITEIDADIYGREALIRGVGGDAA